MRIPQWLWPQPTGNDGFGQSHFEDLRFLWRFRGCRKRAALWRAPDDAERRHYDAHALFGRFGNHTLARAEVDGRRWIVRERDWHGWPDPPRFVFFAIEAGDRIWCGADFHHWPQAWGGLPDPFKPT